MTWDASPGEKDIQLSLCFVVTNIQKKCTKDKRHDLHQMVLENWVCIFKRVKLEQYLASYTNINSKQMKDLNVRPKTLKLVEKKNRAHTQAIDIGKDFLPALW